MSIYDKIHAVVNPRAGHGLAGKRWPCILHYLKSQGYEVIFRLTRRRYHAYYIAQRFVDDGLITIIGALNGQ